MPVRDLEQHLAQVRGGVRGGLLFKGNPKLLNAATFGLLTLKGASVPGPASCRCWPPAVLLRHAGGQVGSRTRTITPRTTPREPASEVKFVNVTLVKHRQRSQDNHAVLPHGALA